MLFAARTRKTCAEFSGLSSDKKFEIAILGPQWFTQCYNISIYFRFMAPIPMLHYKVPLHWIVHAILLQLSEHKKL